jgi:hypothetical protein
MKHHIIDAGWFAGVRKHCSAKQARGRGRTNFFPSILSLLYICPTFYMARTNDRERERIERSYSGRPPVGTIKQGMKLFNAR